MTGGSRSGIQTHPFTWEQKNGNSRSYPTLLASYDPISHLHIRPRPHLQKLVVLPTPLLPLSAPNNSSLYQPLLPLTYRITCLRCVHVYTHVCGHAYTCTQVCVNNCARMRIYTCTGKGCMNNRISPVIHTMNNRFYFPTAPPRLSPLWMSIPS